MKLKDQLQSVGKSILEYPQQEIPERGTEKFAETVSSTPSLKLKQDKKDIQTAPKSKKRKTSPSPKIVKKVSPKRQKLSTIAQKLQASLAAVPMTEAQPKHFAIGTKTEVLEDGSWYPAIVTEFVSGQGAHGIRKLKYEVDKWKGWTLRIDLDDQDDRSTIRLRPQAF